MLVAGLDIMPTTIEVTPRGWRVRQRADVLHECVGWVIRPGHAPWDVANMRATECNAVVRVERATRYDPFGVLNLMPYRHTTPERVLTVAAVRRREVRSCEGQVSERRVRNGVAIVDQAAVQLATESLIRTVVDRVEGDHVSTGGLRCPVSMGVLDRGVRRSPDELGSSRGRYHEWRPHNAYQHAEAPAESANGGNGSAVTY